MKFKGILIVLCLSVLISVSPVVAQTPEELLGIHKAQMDAMNAHDIDTMMSYWADDGMYDLVSSPPAVPKAYVEYGYSQRFAARPDFRMTDGRAFAVDNVVVEEAMTLYTDAGSGAEVVIPHLSIYEFEGDKIKKVTSYNDKVGPMIMRGELPAPEPVELIPSIEVPDPESTGLSPVEADMEYIKRWNGHDLAHIAKMYHPDLSIFIGPFGTSVDRNQATAMNEIYFAAFPDIKLEVARRIDLNQGWILTEYVTNATHQGDYMGVTASNYPTGIRAVWLAHYDADGLLTEMSFYYDNLTLINQITTAPFSLDGIWITTSPTPLGNWISTTNYVALDAAKTQYSGTLEFINGFPLFMDLYPDEDPSLVFSAGGHAVMVGRNRYEATYLTYDRKFDASTGIMEIVGIDTLNAHFEVVGPDQIVGQGMASYYMAAQDADQDGFPDEGQEPVACFPWEWTSKRLTVMPGCTPQ